MNHQAEIGIFGGSGLYQLFNPDRQVKIHTPYGPTSDLITLAEHQGRKLAFLPRHGSHHTLPPHRIPFRANLWAMKELGVKQIIAPCAVGSLQKDIKVGDLVVADQFIDRTTGRIGTFYEGPQVAHVSMAHPFCPAMGELLYQTAKDQGYPVHKGGTAVVIQGPRFSTTAESLWFTRMGWHIVNMTMYPEVALARELEICYANISIITDYDAGILQETAPVSSDEVMKIFAANLEKVKKLLDLVIPQLPQERNCECASALAHALVP